MRVGEMLLDFRNRMLGQILGDFRNDATRHIGMESALQLSKCARRSHHDNRIYVFGRTSSSIADAMRDDIHPPWLKG